MRFGCKGLIEYGDNLVRRCSIIPFLDEQPGWVGMLVFGISAIMFILISLIFLKAAYKMYIRKKKEFSKDSKKMFTLLIVFGILMWYPVYISISNLMFFSFQ